MDQEQLIMSAVQVFLIIQGKLKESVVLGSRFMCSLGWPGSQIENLLLLIQQQHLLKVLLKSE